MNAKEYLKQYRKITKQLKRIQNEIETLRAAAESFDVIGDGTPRSRNAGDSVANIAVKIADLKSEYEDILIEAIEKRLEIVKVIEEVENAAQSHLLYDRYVLGMKWEDIALELHYDENYTRGRLHGAALQNVSRIINP